MTTNNSDRLLGYAFTVLSALLYATLPIIVKLGLSVKLEPGVMLFLRYSMALVILAVYLGMIRRTHVVALSPLNIVQGILLIMVGFLDFYSLKYLPASVAGVTLYTYPLFTALLAVVIFREHLSLRTLICILSTIGGIAMVSGLGHASDISFKGILLSLGASLSYAIFSLVGQKTTSETSPLSLTATFSLVAVVVIPIFSPHTISIVPHLGLEAYVVGAAMALLNTVLAVTFFLKGVDKIGASTAGLLSTAEPALTVILAFLILHEKLGLVQAAGVVLIFASILVAVYNPRSVQ